MIFKNIREAVRFSGERMAKVTFNDSTEPFHIAHHCRTIEAKFLAHLARVSGVAVFCRIADAKSPGISSVPAKISREAARSVANPSARRCDISLSKITPSAKLSRKHNHYPCRIPREV